jgi:hypothetical protein
VERSETEEEWRALTESIIETAIDEVERGSGGGGVRMSELAVLLGQRLARIYDLHTYAPARAKDGGGCWCPECGEIGEYPDPCATARLVVGGNQ